MAEIPDETYEVAAIRLAQGGDMAMREGQLFATLAVARQLERIADSLDTLKERGNFNQREF